MPLSGVFFCWAKDLAASAGRERCASSAASAACAAARAARARLAAAASLAAMALASAISAARISALRWATRVSSRLLAWLAAATTRALASRQLAQGVGGGGNGLGGGAGRGGGLLLRGVDCGHDGQVVARERVDDRGPVDEAGGVAALVEKSGVAGRALGVGERGDRGDRLARLDQLGSGGRSDGRSSARQPGRPWPGRSGPSRSPQRPAPTGPAAWPAGPLPRRSWSRCRRGPRTASGTSTITPAMVEATTGATRTRVSRGRATDSRLLLPQSADRVS